MKQDGKIEIIITDEYYKMDFKLGDCQWESVLLSLIQAIENLTDDVVCEDCVSDIKDIKNLCDQLRVKTLWVKYKFVKRKEK